MCTPLLKSLATGLEIDQLHDRILRWEFMDMSNFYSCSAIDETMVEANIEKLVVLTGFEVSQPPNFITWIHNRSEGVQ